jgi:hypothetical protein
MTGDASKRLVDIGARSDAFSIADAGDGLADFP